MTVSITTRSQNFSGGQQALTFTFPASVDRPEDITVIEKLTATGVETTLTYNTDYTVTISTSGIGGTVRVSPTYSTSYTQVVRRVTTKTQAADYEDYSQFPADTLEASLDQATMIVQELNEERLRTVIKDYGTGATSGSTISLANAIIVYGTKATLAAGGNQVISGLPFTATTSYIVQATIEGTDVSGLDAPNVTRNSASQFTIYNPSASAQTIMWLAIGT